MKTSMNMYSRVFLVLTLLVIYYSGPSFGQRKKTTRMQVEYRKDHNKAEYLIATIRVREERYVPLTNVLVQFYIEQDTSNVLLDKIRTNEEGVASLLLNDKPNLHVDPEGLITFLVEYSGSTSNQASERDISIKRADLELSFFQKDSIKSIEVDAFERLSEEELIPIEGINIQFFIEGTFSQLKFGEGKTDKDGHLKYDFPVDMPGDTAGVLTIVGKIIEDDILGTIEAKGKINWGIPVPLQEETHRGLGDTDAPLWMVYTLIILLSAVWFHYMYVIFLIVKIKFARRSPKIQLREQ